MSLEEAEVVAVSSDGYRVTVRTRSGKKLDTQILANLAALGADTDTFAGAGITVCPEVGSIAAVISTSYGEHYTFGFVQPYTNSQGYQGNREQRRQGDMTLRSKNGSFLDVLSSGMARAGASDIAQTTYSPEDDSVRNIAQNFFVRTGLGSLEWTVDEDTRKGSYRVQSQAGLEEGAPSATLALGDSTSGNLAELSTSSGGASSFAIERAGNVRVDSDKDTTVLASGKIRQEAKKIFMNSGTAKLRQAFQGNFFQLPTASILPGQPAPMFKFPTQLSLRTSLPTPDPKRLLQLPQISRLVPTLPTVPDVSEAGRGLLSNVTLPTLPKIL
jgi:hypothetical protein